MKANRTLKEIQTTQKRNYKDLKRRFLQRHCDKET